MNSLLFNAQHLGFITDGVAQILKSVYGFNVDVTTDTLNLYGWTANQQTAYIHK